MHVCTSMLMAAAANPEATYTGNFVFTMALITGAVVGVVSLIYMGKRNPPLSEEMYRDFATRKEFGDQNTACDESFRRVYTRIEKEIDGCNKRFLNIERDLGRIEGQIERQPKANRDEYYEQ